MYWMITANLTLIETKCKTGNRKTVPRFFSFHLAFFKKILYYKNILVVQKSFL